MKILFLHEVGYLEKPIFEMHEFPEYLAKKGHLVAFADYPETRIRDSNQTFGSYVEGRVLSDVKLKLYSQRSMAPGILGRLLAALFFPIFLQRVLRDFKPDLVVSFAVPTSGWQTALFCRVTGLQFVFRALDVSHKIRRSFFAPIVRIAEKIVYSRAAWVSCNNPAMAEYCISLGAKRESTSVEYPPLDLSHFLTIETKRDIRRELGIWPESRVILYMGSFFYFSGLAEVLRGLALLKDKPQLVLVGGGEQEAELRRIAKGLQLEEFVTFTGFVEFEELPAYLSIADVAINPMAPSLVSHKALPNKVLQYMASGLPVVTTHLDGLSSVFSEAEGIHTVSDSEMVLTAAMEMLDLPGLGRIGESNRLLVASKFDVTQSVDFFEERLIGLGGS